MVVKAAIGFASSDTDPQLVIDVQSILTGLTGNASFPAPSPSLNAVTSALKAFSVALANAANGGKELTAIKNASRSELVSLVRLLASYVTVTSNGDMAKLLSSGFPIQKPTRTTIGTLPAPSAPVVSQGALSGSLSAVSSPVYGASSYNWSVALQSAPDTDVQSAQTTGARAVFSGLTPGQVYVVSLNAVGAAGASDWSDYGSLMVI